MLQSHGAQVKGPPGRRRRRRPPLRRKSGGLPRQTRLQHAHSALPRAHGSVMGSTGSGARGAHEARLLRMAEQVASCPAHWRAARLYAPSQLSLGGPATVLPQACSPASAHRTPRPCSSCALTAGAAGGAPTSMCSAGASAASARGKRAARPSSADSSCCALARSACAVPKGVG